MTPFTARAAVLCDDIRQEAGNNKYMLIGVYGSEVTVNGFPAQLMLSWWLLLTPRQTGPQKGEVRVIHSNGSVLTQGEVEFDIKEAKDFISVLARLPIQIQNEGSFRLEFNFEGKWEVIHEANISLRNPSTNVAA